MNLRTPMPRVATALLLGALLGACAMEPAKPPPRPAIVIARPAPPPPRVSPVRRTTATREPWTGLGASFVLQDCGPSSLIEANAAMYTRNPHAFERQIKRALPLLLYVQQQLHDAGIPGEFALLPYLESSYRPNVASAHGNAAGLWQFVPATARQHGLIISRHYDGRRDPIASTRAAIQMLQALHHRFGDWRLADIAYNFGPYAVSTALRTHPDLGRHPIPDIPVSRTARNHLARLMALSCILRKPDRYHVKLPQPTPADDLMAVAVPAGTALQAAADMAGWPLAELRSLNPGYRSTTIPTNSPRALLLPAAAGGRLVSALEAENSKEVAEVAPAATQSSDAGDPTLPVATAALVDDASPTHVSPRSSLHRVGDGETLWSIAQQYHVSVDTLKRWNHLQGDTVQSGETLQVQANY